MSCQRPKIAPLTPRIVVGRAVTEEVCASKKFSYSLFLFGQLMGNDRGGSCGLQEGFNLEAEGGFLGSTGSGVF
jgi:hypothetical protein